MFKNFLLKPFTTFPDSLTHYQKLLKTSDHSFSNLFSGNRFPNSQWEVLIVSLKVALPLLKRSIMWRVVEAIGAIICILLLRSLVEENTSVISLSLAGLCFTVFKILSAFIDFFDAARKQLISHVIRAFFLALINSKLKTLAPHDFKNLNQGELKTLALSDTGHIEDFISTASFQVVPFIVSLVLLGPVFIFFNGGYGLLALCLALMSLPFSYFSSIFFVRLSLEAQGYLDEVLSRKGEWIRQIRLVRFLGWTPWITRQIEQSMKRYLYTGAKRSFVACIIYGFSWSWHLIVLVTVLLIQYFNNELPTLVAIFGLMWLLEQFASTLSPIPYCLEKFGESKASAKRLAEFFIHRELKDFFLDNLNYLIDETPRYFILENVKINFEEDLALNIPYLNIDLQTHTAIIGEVASGKSLLLEIIAGERPVSSGKVYIATSSGQQYPFWNESVYAWYRSYIAYAPQQPYLSNETLRNNITLSKFTDENTLQTATGEALLNADISLFTNGIDEEVGEIGINLSGGQKHRVSIARALASKRSIFIFDDPLSAVDPNTESQLADNLFKPHRGIVLSSHRLKELTRCNRLLVLENGIIVEDGNPKELVADKNSKFTDFIFTHEILKDE
jgi:ABC-type bacteriocin/lantibiotic exporter with double-glycine peptidase domain